MTVKNQKSRDKVFNCIVEWFRKRGYPPTLRELGTAAGLRSTWTVRHHLRKLAEEGYIKVEEGLSRGIKLLKGAGGIPISGVPIIGRVAAGNLSEAIENLEGYVNLSGVFDTEGVFALRTRGDSMTGAGILNGDLVFVRKQPTAHNGEIVLALVGDDAVVKRFYKRSGTVELVSENPAYKPIKAHDVKIFGKVVGVLRNYERNRN